MKIKDIMTDAVVVISPGASIHEAARLMRSLNIGVLPVCEGGQILGILTDRDLTVRAISELCDLPAVCVEDVMTRDVAWCFEDSNLKTVEDIMQERQVRRLPVLDHEEHLVGIVSLGDIATRSHDSGVASTLEEISLPTAAG